MNAGSKEMTRCIDPGKERVAPVEQALRTPRHDAAALLVPRRLQQLRLHLARAGDDLAQILDRAPSVAELAAHLQLSREQVTEGLVVQRLHRQLPGRPVRRQDQRRRHDRRAPRPYRPRPGRH